MAIIPSRTRRRRQTGTRRAPAVPAPATLLLIASLTVYAPAAAADIQDVVFTSQSGEEMALGTSLNGMTLSPWGPLGSSGHLYIRSQDRSSLNLTLGGRLKWNESLGFLGYAGLSGSAWVQMKSGASHSSSLPQSSVSLALEGSWTKGPLALRTGLSVRSDSFDTSPLPILGVSATPFSVAEPGATSRLRSVGQPPVGDVPGGWSWQAGSRYRLNRKRTYTLEVAAWQVEGSPSAAPGWRVFGGEERRGAVPGLWWSGIGVGIPYAEGLVADGAAGEGPINPLSPALLLQVGTRQTLATTSYGPVKMGAQVGTALRGSGTALNSFAFEMETPLSSTTRLSGTVETTGQTLRPTLSLHFSPSSWEGGEVLLRWEQLVKQPAGAERETVDSSIFLGLHVRP